MSTLLIRNGAIVTPDSCLQSVDLLVKDGHIAEVSSRAVLTADQVIDAAGKFVMPGIIDLHTDALESEITPRPGANFPLEVALQEIDTKMLSCGITTVYHSIHLGYKDADVHSKSKYTRKQIIEATSKFARESALCNSKIHLRFEITGTHALDTLEDMMENGVIDLLSFMDHTPGQGQYPREQFIKNQTSKGFTEEQATEELERRQSRSKVSREDLKRITKRANELGIPVASHDDDRPELVQKNFEMGLTISEFPINVETAAKATALGMQVLGGASNVLRGGSLSGNLCMTEAIKAGFLDGLCSDYYPPSIYHSIFKLHREEGLTLPQSTNLATLTPAFSAGIQANKGSLEVGKDADIILVELKGELPRITHTIVNGQLVFASQSNPKGKANPSYNNKIESQPDFANA